MTNIRIAVISLSVIFFFSCSGLQTRGTFSSYSDISAADVLLWEEVDRGVYRTNFSVKDSGITVYALKIDLSEKGREIVVSKGTGRRMSFKSTTVKRFMKQTGLVAAINANPFDRYCLFPGQRQKAVGVVLSDGVLYSPPASYSALVFTSDNRAVILDPPVGSLDSYKNGVGGFFTVLRDGNIVAGESEKDVRSLAGNDISGRILYLAVVFGKGVDFRSSARIMRYIGADDAMLLDGGGSSVLAVRVKETYRIKVINTPEGGPLFYFKRLAPVFLGIR